MTNSPYNGTPPCTPIHPIAAVATHEMTVNHTTHGLRRRRASEIAPNTGADTAIKIDEKAVPQATAEFDDPRSTTSHVVKYSDATFIDQIVFAKS